MLHKYLRYIPLVCISMSANAAQQSSVAPTFGTGSLLQVFMGLAFVIFIIFMLSIVLRKLNMVPGSSNKLINIVSAVSLNNKDRLLLVQVGDEQILVSACPGHIGKIHKMKTPVEINTSAALDNAATNKFSMLLGSVMSGKKVPSDQLEKS